MSKPLLKDLQELVQAGIISADTARNITNYYTKQKETSPGKFNIILGVAGSLLASLGIILVVAHNWDELNRVTQTIFAFLPLVIGQGLCVYTLLRKKESMVWRESSAVILFFAVASCISLISQVYHISGPLSDFVLTWLLLTIPLIYLLSSPVLSLLVIVTTTWYGCLAGYGSIFNAAATQVPYMYFILLLLVVPHYYRYVKYNRNSNFFHLHNWLLALSVTITLGAFSESYYPFQWVFIGYIVLFGLFYLLGVSDYFRNNRLFANPFYIIGILGMLFVLMCWSFDLLWRDLDEQNRRFFLTPFFYITLLLLATGLYLIFRNNKNNPGKQFDLIGLSPYLFTLCIILFSRNTTTIGLFIINAWILATAIFYIRKGSMLDHLGILNFGLLIMAILAVLRFFDDSIPFIWRGIFFVVAGIGFFTANYLLLKKRKSLIQNKNA